MPRARRGSKWRAMPPIARARPRSTGRISHSPTAGREASDHAFLTEALVEHVSTQLAALDRLEQHGYAFPDRKVTVLASPAESETIDLATQTRSTARWVRSGT